MVTITKGSVKTGEAATEVMVANWTFGSAHEPKVFDPDADEYAVRLALKVLIDLPKRHWIDGVPGTFSIPCDGLGWLTIPASKLIEPLPCFDIQGICSEQLMTIIGEAVATGFNTAATFRRGDVSLSVEPGALLTAKDGDIVPLLLHTNEGAD